MRLAVAVVFSLTVASCRTQQAVPPSPSSPASATARPTAAALPTSTVGTMSHAADGTVVVSIPDCLVTHVGAAISGCEVLQAGADTDVFVAVLRWTDGYFEARSVDLSSGEMRTLIAKEDLGIQLEDVRGDIALLLEIDNTGAGTAHARLLRVPWRDPTKADTLDEIDLVGLGGGDTWNPWPAARTNGKDIAWLHAGGALGKHQLVLLDFAGRRHIVGETDRPIWFDLDYGGGVPVAVFNADGSSQRFFYYLAGTVHEMGMRDAANAGYVMSFGRYVGWTLGTGTVRPIDGIDLSTDTGKGIGTQRPEPGCTFVGRTYKDLVSVCPSGTRLKDVFANTIRDGPPSRVVLSFPRALLWRTTADLAANPQVWRVTLV